ncbi:hypothetical protein JTE90_024379 [Oedothorax gibbosus]|uniref:G-protein coupled receptors family 1 profile domain-containing protein n=1 Tax=Oedothorax gibbosus TaxID=931172 RepID=A0AAV6TRP0_9ARAC|nr:hypothetical protein JTE90_026724 [Oedothorax gibbosus]KAG8174374.1 hypothetical protein JTE90_024379 [Oedothorax gibbosus]
MAVVHPLESRTQQTRGRARRILAGVWAAPALVSAPFLAWPAGAVRSSLRSPLGAMERLSCAVGLPGGVRRPYYTALFVLLYALPGLLVAGTCARVARCLLKGIPVSRQGSVRRQEADRRKVID